MANISMDYNAVGTLEEKAAFLQYGFSEMIGQFERLTEELESRWDGKGKTDFGAKCEALLPRMEAISDTFTKYKTVLGQAVYLQKSTEAASAADANHLSF